MRQARHGSGNRSHEHCGEPYDPDASGVGISCDPPYSYLSGWRDQGFACWLMAGPDRVGGVDLTGPVV